MKDYSTPPFFVIPQVTIHSDCLYLYGRLEWVSAPSGKRLNSLKNLEDNSHHNKLSSNASRKLKKAVKYLLYNACNKKVYSSKKGSMFNFKVQLITLTLAAQQVDSDEVIKSKLLNHFFLNAKRKWNMVNYVWKAERQANGNIHFHILSDVYIPHRELRDTWNNIQAKLSYIDEFKKVHGHISPNSTDIHSLRNVKNAAAYVTKYIAKNEQLSNMEGRIWGCSQNLSNIEGAKVELNDEIVKEIERLQKEEGAKRIDDEHFSIVLFDQNFITKKNYPLLYTIFHTWHKERFKLARAQTIFD